MKIKNKLKEWRVRKGDLTQEELAKKIGVSRQTINAIEKGKYLPSLQLAFKLSLFFDVPIEEIFYVVNNKKRG